MIFIKAALLKYNIQIKNTMAKRIVKSYRDLNYDEVEKYAEKNMLNIETEENFRQAAIELYYVKYAKKTGEYKVTCTIELVVKAKNAKTAMKQVAKDINAQIKEGKFDMDPEYFGVEEIRK
jgi:hypothetical protein